MSFLSLNLLMAAGFVAGILVCFELGRRIGRSALAAGPDGLAKGVGPAEGAVFALLGLIIAFMFSGAAARFEARHHLVTQEANAIGTAWLRLDLLPLERRLLSGLPVLSGLLVLSVSTPDHFEPCLLSRPLFAFAPLKLELLLELEGDLALTTAAGCRAGILRGRLVGGRCRAQRRRQSDGAATSTAAVRPGDGAVRGSASTSLDGGTRLAHGQPHRAIRADELRQGESVRRTTLRRERVCTTGPPAHSDGGGA